MRKLPLLFAFTLLSAISIQAQTPSGYRFDNFDTSTGVRVELPPEPAKTPAGKKHTRLTARSGARMEKAGLKLSEDSTPTPSATMADGKALDGFSTGNAAVDSLIVESGVRNGIDPVLIYAVMHQESTFKQRALSPKGARGLMQLMPPTARRFGVQNIYDPRENIEGGARYMRWLLDYFGGDVRLALAGYNAGEGAVMKYGRRIPPYSETQNYVRRIFQRYTLMRDPQAARRAPTVTSSQVAAISKTEKPGVVYAQSVFVVRMPDGKLRLVSQ